LGAKWAQNYGQMGTNRSMAGEQGQPNQREFCGFMERAMGIEPTSEAWDDHTGFRSENVLQRFAEISVGAGPDDAGAVR
jgi:hypothetical protein